MDKLRLSSYESISIRNSSLGSLLPTQQHNVFHTNLGQVKISPLKNYLEYLMVLTMAKQDLLGNVKGFFKNKSQQYFVVTRVDDSDNLANFVNSSQFVKKIVDEGFFTSLILQIMDKFAKMESLKCKIKVLHPKYILLNVNSSKNLVLSFKYPYLYDLFNPNLAQSNPQIQEFASPQILRLRYNLEKSQRTQFDKSGLYSLGLICFYCFRCKFSVQQRVNSLRDSREMNKYMKQIRKEVKIHHEGKFISKLLKLMLENSQPIRDTLETFKIKMNSPQFLNLRNTKKYLQQIYSETIISESNDEKPHLTERAINIIMSQDNCTNSMQNLQKINQIKPQQEQQKCIEDGEPLNSPIYIDLGFQQDLDYSQQAHQMKQYKQKEQQEYQMQNVKSIQCSMKMRKISENQLRREEEDPAIENMTRASCITEVIEYEDSFAQQLKKIDIMKNQSNIEPDYLLRDNYHRKSKLIFLSLVLIHIVMWFLNFLLSE